VVRREEETAELPLGPEGDAGGSAIAAAQWLAEILRSEYSV
jgi:hypothetical protein